MSRRLAIRIATLTFVVLTLGHLDFWRPQRARLLFDVVPEELAYRISYCLIAWLWMLFVCARVWREERD